jgi:hypothetical protein
VRPAACVGVVNTFDRRPSGSRRSRSGVTPREFYGGRRFDLRAQAMAWAEEIKRDLENDGWMVTIEEGEP